MKRIILLVLTCFTLLSCNSQTPVKDEVKIDIENDRIYYVSFKDMHYLSSYTDNNQRDESISVLNYKVTNNSNKKYLFLVKDIELMNIKGLYIQIKKDNKIINASAPLGEFGHEYIDSCHVCKSNLLLTQEIKKSKLLKILGAKGNVGLFEGFLNQSVILEPGESREFSTIVSLPYLQEADPKQVQYFFGYKLKEGENYIFSLRYKIDSKELTSTLTTKQLEELKRNKVEIFDGEIFSNEIQLLPKQ